MTDWSRADLATLAGAGELHITSRWIDQAYRDEYARYGPTHLNPVLGPSARAATVRVIPQTTSSQQQGASS